MLYLSCSILFIIVLSQRGGSDDRDRDDYNGPSLCPTSSPGDSRSNSNNDYSDCSWWGDPHFQTFDGLIHHYQGRGPFEYVTSCRSNYLSVPFEIVGQQIPRPSRPNAPVSVVDYIVVKLFDFSANSIREVTMNDRFVFSDSTMTDPNSPAPLGCRIYYNNGNSYYIVTKSTTNGDNYLQLELYTGLLDIFKPDLVLRVSYSATRGYVFLNEYYEESVCGLCGYYDGRSDNDLTYYNGEECVTIDSDGLDLMRQTTSEGWSRLNFFARQFRDDDNDIDDLVAVMPTDNCLAHADDLCDREYELVCSCDNNADYKANFVKSCAYESCSLAENDIYNLDDYVEVTREGCQDRCNPRH